MNTTKSQNAACRGGVPGAGAARCGCGCGAAGAGAGRKGACARCRAEGRGLASTAGAGVAMAKAAATAGDVRQWVLAGLRESAPPLGAGAAYRAGHRLAVAIVCQKLEEELALAGGGEGVAAALEGGAAHGASPAKDARRAGAVHVGEGESSAEACGPEAGPAREMPGVRFSGGGEDEEAQHFLVAPLHVRELRPEHPLAVHLALARRHFGLPP